MLHFTAVRYVLFIAPKSRMRSLKSGFVGLISKQKLEKNTMVPCGSLTKPLHGSSVGISTAGFILADGTGCVHFLNTQMNFRTEIHQGDFTICLIG